MKLPLYDVKISAGFPSPAEESPKRALDLHELVVDHPAATFFVRVEGDSMRGAGIETGDILVVDRSLPAKSGKVVIALVEGEFTVKRLILEGEKGYLMAENPRYPNLSLDKNKEFQVWGVVTYVIHRTR